MLRRARGLGRLWRLGIGVAALASGCAGLRNTPQQDAAYESWRACAPPSAVVDLQRIEPDGRIWFWYVLESERQEVTKCLTKAGGSGGTVPEPVAVLRRGGL